MTKDVLLSIRGLQFVAREEEDIEPVEMITAGDYYKKNGKHYIMYDEVMEGFDGNTRNIISSQYCGAFGSNNAFLGDKSLLSTRGLYSIHMSRKKNGGQIQRTFYISIEISCCTSDFFSAIVFFWYNLIFF